MKNQKPQKQHGNREEKKSLKLRVPVEQGVNASYDRGILTVKGSKGEVSKKLRYPGIVLSVEGQEVLITVDKLTQREKKLAFTYRAHINNMMYGVNKGYEYTLKVVHAKFPMDIKVQGNKVTLKNFLGEKVPRIITIPEDVKVVIKGDEITVNGIDKEKAGQVAGSLEQMTRVTHLDRRKIQDGIFITSKPHRVYSE